MMTTQLGDLKIRGTKHAQSGLGLMCLSSVIILGVSFMILGTDCFRFFIISCVGFNLFFVLILYNYNLTNNFVFDDKSQKIKKAPFIRIPYGKICEIIISQRKGHYFIRVKKQHRLLPYLLVGGISKKDAELAEKEFKQRFDESIIHSESYTRQQRRKAVIGVVLMIATVVFGNLAMNFVLRDISYKVVSPINKDWLNLGHNSAGIRYQIEGISFRLPAYFVQVRREKTHLHFEDKYAGIKLSVVVDTPLSSDHNSQVMQFMTGLRTDLDWNRIGYTARYGLIPTMMNSLLFDHLSDIKLYELRHGSIQGIVVQGINKGKFTAQILLAMNNRTISFYLSKPTNRGEIPEIFLRKVVSSVDTA